MGRKHCSRLRLVVLFTRHSSAAGGDESRAWATGYEGWRRRIARGSEQYTWNSDQDRAENSAAGNGFSLTYIDLVDEIVAKLSKDEQRHVQTIDEATRNPKGTKWTNEERGWMSKKGKLVSINARDEMKGLWSKRARTEGLIMGLRTQAMASPLSG